MRFYNTQHAFYCGIDLHARSMFTHILDQAGKKKALAVLEAKIGRTVYHLMRKQQPFDAQRFFSS